MQFVNRPNLPQGSVKLFAITANKPALQLALSAIGVQTITTGPCEALSGPVAFHPDMILQHLGGNQLLLAKNGICEEETLRSLGFKLQKTQKLLQPEYPGDILLNTLHIGAFAFGRKAQAAPELLTYLESTNVRFLEIRQGYARCSTCIIAENAIATADTGIQKAAEAVGIDCLHIPPGEVLLEGYPYGFLGGCCGLLSPSILAIYGNVEILSYHAQLKCFAARHNVELLSLGTGIPPTDVGTLMPLLCE